MASTRIEVHLDDPMATVEVAGDDRRVVSWPDLDVGLRSATSTVLAGPSGVWVMYRPMESEDPGFPAGHAAAVHISVDADVTCIGGLEHSQPVGVTRHGLWLTSDAFPDPQDETATRVEVSFTHPHHPYGRLRRTLPVFDGAGRAIPALYAAIHLMEDLDTNALPSTGEARDGVLDI